ncbi:hypothetical protein [Rheinheimera soli]|uniref:hypothetical protein n=1 Tax=Rheinheimera soli TaxID=443616 RepID=UPI001E39157A|nr:hypothetical protein [Rheinheimera soli]
MAQESFRFNAVQPQNSKPDSSLALLQPVSFPLVTTACDRVINLVVKIGSHIQAGVLLLTLLPPNSELRALLLILARAYDVIQHGLQTRLRFGALLYKHFATFQSESVNTAQNIVMPNEVEMSFPIKELVNKIEVPQCSLYICADNNAVPQQSSVLLSTDVILENHRL